MVTLPSGMNWMRWHMLDAQSKQMPNISFHSLLVSVFINCCAKHTVIRDSKTSKSQVSMKNVGECARTAGMKNGLTKSKT